MNIVWPPLTNEKMPWTLKEEAATKKQILEQAKMIKDLKRRLEESERIKKGDEESTK